DNRLGASGFSRKADRKPQHETVASCPKAPSAQPRAERDPHPPDRRPGHRSLQRRPYPGEMEGSMREDFGAGISFWFLALEAPKTWCHPGLEPGSILRCWWSDHLAVAGRSRDGPRVRPGVTQWVGWHGRETQP